MQRRVELADVLGRRVFTILTEPDVSSGRLLVMAHGFRGSSLGPAREFVDLERLLVEDGIACLRFDQPCSGNSDGDFRDSSFVVWVDTIVELARRNLEAGYRVGLLGQSMGGAATIVATARPAIKGRVPAAILWSPGIDDVQEFPGREFIDSPTRRTWTKAVSACVPASGGKHMPPGSFGPSMSSPAQRILCSVEHDHFDPEGLRHHAIARVKAMGHEVTVLPGRDHSGWDYNVAQEVYGLEGAFLGDHDGRRYAMTESCHSARRAGSRRSMSGTPSKPRSAETMRVMPRRCMTAR